MFPGGHHRDITHTRLLPFQILLVCPAPQTQEHPLLFGETLIQSHLFRSLSPSPQAEGAFPSRGGQKMGVLF